MRELTEQGLENGSPTGKRPRAGGRSVQVNLAESPLSWLRARDLIDARQYAAGERLRADYETASLGPCVTMRWEASPIGRGRRGAPDSIDPTLAQIAAKRRFDAAVAAAGPGLSDILWRVVCAGERLPDAEKALGWPARAGRLVLTLALDRLAAQYRLV
ncbi:DUF6456 domain-containing protein [Sphingomonas qomolangmaensis]|uniref:DUF6456 domain-containing protein n=1 Tax=Sphingomonas qomolangmaensis TaxID=2918765 RepID=A0ABY5L3I5_9SPHN|nr:DUF6456 domain-containing protein [Sphingomonas qomolangmaensis]UUL81530.1 DUF6456 domain-containing protein [Sphingomonas qomolangmaensis]